MHLRLFRYSAHLVMELNCWFGENLMMVTVALNKETKGLEQCSSTSLTEGK